MKPSKKAQIALDRRIRHTLAIRENVIRNHYNPKVRANVSGAFKLPGCRNGRK